MEKERRRREVRGVTVPNTGDLVGDVVGDVVGDLMVCLAGDLAGDLGGITDGGSVWCKIMIVYCDFVRSFCLTFLDARKRNESIVNTA